MHRGADGCHVNMPGRLEDWVVTSRMSWRSRGEEGEEKGGGVGGKQKLNYLSSSFTKTDM